MNYPINEEWFIKRWMEQLDKPDEADRDFARAFVQCINHAYECGKKDKTKALE